jgi:hypothetical protein
MSVLAMGFEALWKRQSQFWTRKMEKIVRRATIARIVIQR